MEKKRERRGVRSQGRGSRAGLRRRGRIRPANSRALVALCRQRDGQGLCPALPCPALPCSPCPALPCPALSALPALLFTSLPCSPCPALPALRAEPRHPRDSRLGSRGVSGAAGAEDAPQKSLPEDPKLSPKPSRTMLSRDHGNMSLALAAA